MDEETLLKLAEKELLEEAKRAATRYDAVGPSGWNPCPLQKTNKTFLVNTLRQAISSNRIIERKNAPKVKFRERKMLQNKNMHGVNNDNFVFKRKEKSANSKESKIVSEKDKSSRSKRDNSASKKDR